MVALKLHCKVDKGNQGFQSHDNVTPESGRPKKSRNNKFQPFESAVKIVTLFTCFYKRNPQVL